MDSAETLDKGLTHRPGRRKGGGGRFHHAPQNGMQFKINELFISGILPFNIFEPEFTASD